MKYYLQYCVITKFYRLDYGLVRIIAAVAISCTNKIYNYSFVVILLHINAI